MKLGFNGIALACAVFCSTLVSAPTPEQSTKSNPEISKVRPLETYPLHVFELFFYMKDKLWPEADGSDIRLTPVDAAYNQLTAEEITELVAYWNANKAKLPYMEETWDCDDFANEFAYWARRWVAERTRGESAPPAVGCAYIAIVNNYEIGTRKIVWVKGTIYHVVNVILRDDGQWFFFEPQSGRMIPIEGPIYEGTIQVIKVAI